jgi:hypothetical protein
MTSLEHRYRRLISLYPAAHRRRYQMEMLSTLMDGAGENQRTPRFRESIDLLWNAIWLRLNRDGGPPERDPRWAQAAAVFGVLGAMMVAGLHVMVPLGEFGWSQRMAETWSFWLRDPTWVPFAQGVAWLLVAVIALLGRRRVAAAVGWVTVALTLVWLLREYPNESSIIVRHWTLVVFGVTVAGCLTLAKGPLLLRARHVAVFGGVSAAWAVSLWADAMLTEVRMFPDGSAEFNQWGMDFPALPGIGTSSALPLAAIALFLSVAVWIQYKVDARVRRRLRAYAWVPLATYILVYTQFDFWLVRAISPVHWAGLILVPLAVFGTAVIVVRRKDSQQRLIELGRAQL